MRLPDLLMERGIDPEEFLTRASVEGNCAKRRSFYSGPGLVLAYVDLALSWVGQPEG
jgi:hypothetical protein